MLFDAYTANDNNGKGQLISPPKELNNGQGCLEFYYNAYGF